MVGNVSSDMSSIIATVKPTINTDIVELMSETNSSVISFSYTDNDNVFDSYCFTLVGGRTREKKCKNKTDSNRIVRYSGLYAGSVYTIVAVTNSVDMMSDPLRAYIMTDPRNVEVTFEPKERRVIVSLDNQEGRAIGYVVLCRSSDNIDCGRQVLSGITSFPVTSLSPYHNYSFTVMTTVTGLGVDNKTVQATYIQQTLEDAPEAVQQLTVENVALHTVSVRWMPPGVLNGQLHQYSIEYVETHHSREQDPYNAIIVMSSQTRVQIDGLKAGYDYNFQVKAFTVRWGPVADYNITLITGANLTPLRVGIAVGVVLGLPVSIAVILLAMWGVKIVLEIHRNKCDGQTAGTLQLATLPSYNVARNAIKLKDFHDHVHRMSSDAGMTFADEHESLKTVSVSHKKSSAELLENSSKNRFSNVLPYDHSRVKLVSTQEHDGSDYINANYVPGYASKCEYIATQGPMLSTVNNFWLMVWEQDVTNIIMLTKCVENGQEKCFQYWPSNSDVKYFGNVEVVLLNETHLSHWSITEFCITLNSDSRRVRHFHFKAWPDFGVPEDHSVLIQFVEMVRGKLASNSGPIVVHCSAGVGRTGTYIVLDWSLQMIHEKDDLNIFQIVCTLREHRVLMVQTEQQYKFVHECLACALNKDDGYGRNGKAQFVEVGGPVNKGFEGDKDDNLSTNI